MNNLLKIFLKYIRKRLFDGRNKLKLFRITGDDLNNWHHGSIWKLMWRNMNFIFNAYSIRIIQPYIADVYNKASSKMTVCRAFFFSKVWEEAWALTFGENLLLCHGKMERKFLGQILENLHNFKEISVGKSTANSPCNIR